MDDEGREQRRDGDEDEDEQAVIGAAALRRSARSTAMARRSAPACASPTSAATTGASASMTRPGRMPASRQSAASTNIAASEKRSVSARRSRGRRARPAEEGDAEGLDEAGGGERRRQRQQGADRRHQELQAPLRQLRAQQDRLERQPLGDEAVERRQRRDRRRSRPGRRSAVSGMRWMRPPRCSMSRSPVAVSTAPAPKNSRLLNSEWLKTWNSAAVSASAAAARHAVAP